MISSRLGSISSSVATAPRAATRGRDTSRSRSGGAGATRARAPGRRSGDERRQRGRSCRRRPSRSRSRRHRPGLVDEDLERQDPVVVEAVVQAVDDPAQVALLDPELRRPRELARGAAVRARRHGRGRGGSIPEVLLREVADEHAGVVAEAVHRAVVAREPLLAQPGRALRRIAGEVDAGNRDALPEGRLRRDRPSPTVTTPIRVRSPSGVWKPVAAMTSSTSSFRTPGQSVGCAVTRYPSAVRSMLSTDALRTDVRSRRGRARRTAACSGCGGRDVRAPCVLIGLGDARTIAAPRAGCRSRSRTRSCACRR